MGVGENSIFCEPGEKERGKLAKNEVSYYIGLLK
jgi:hypothetical protein